MEKIIAMYRSYSREYDEDCWEEEMQTLDEISLFNFMKELHLRDARNRNDYPIVSCIDLNKIRFKQAIGKECNLGYFHEDERKDVEKPNYFESALEKYKSWVKELIDKRRKEEEEAEIKKQKTDEEKEKILYEQLKKKYGGLNKKRGRASTQFLHEPRCLDILANFI